MIRGVYFEMQRRGEIGQHGVHARPSAVRRGVGAISEAKTIDLAQTGTGLAKNGDGE
jgi:hypothetical protein